MSVKARIVCGIAVSSIGATAGAGWLDSGYHSAGAAARASRAERVERSAYVRGALTAPVPRGDLRSDIESNAREPARTHPVRRYAMSTAWQ
ncbi:MULTISPECIES: hypothetical protein [Burkholderiaceae]|uniref:hypothetical protein n=1 Tax=Burkholderiaceae TaxID=119060 RepID=UPI00095C7A93|nr:MULTISPECIES: hypothetical protein [Burkholderiaceae]MCF2133662.1 hypothetical protein [Mycetohabitans sp. B3]MCG1039214.1 hypothetical protein [Mycetohabitans sp. B7]SIT67874.1 hypothetical protein SAMN04487769_1197 [Burkholderia sp. b14]